MPSRSLRVRELQLQVEQLAAALAIAEAKLTENREVVFDLLKDMGLRTSCAKCSQPAFWVHHRGAGTGMMINLDGTHHEPLCKGRPAEILEIA